jgi:hypothetical protein
MRRPCAVAMIVGLATLIGPGCKQQPGPETQSREAERERDGEGDRTPRSEGAHDRIGDATVLEGASRDAGAAAGTLDSGDTRDAGGGGETR